MDTKTLQQRLEHKAETDLSKEIQAAVEPFDRFLRDGSNWQIELPGGTAVANRPGVHAYAWYLVLEMLKKEAFSRNIERFTKSQIDDFLADFDRLRSEIQDITDSLEK